MKFKFKLELDRHPGRKVWFGSLDDTISGFDIRARVKMKPRLLKISEDRWLRVDPEETMSIERAADGRGIWHTLRGPFHDLESPGFAEALEKATRGGVFVRISRNFAVSPHRIIGVQLHKEGNHELELEGPQGEPLSLELEPMYLAGLEECLNAINLGDGFLITGPDEEE